MRNITAIKRSDRGTNVGNLQDGLLYLLERIPEIGPEFNLDELRTERAAQTYGKSTTDAVHRFQKYQRLMATGEVDEATAAALNKILGELGAPGFQPLTPTPQPPIPRPPTLTPADFRVNGLVQWVDGRLAAAAIVLAFDKDLRSEELLGQAMTDASGHYEIGYSSSQFKRAEKKTADLLVRVMGRKGELLAESPVVFNAQPVETVNVLLGGTVLIGPSEYTRIEADVEPVLDGVAVADLTDADIKFLSGETGWSQEFLGFYAAAAGLSRQTKVSTEVFYGFAREKLPTTLNLLLAQSAVTQRRALEAAIRDNIIPASVGKTIDGVLDRLKELIVQQAFAQPSQPGKTSLGALIATALPDSRQQVEIVTRYVNHSGTIEEFWDGLRQDPVHAGSVDDLQFTLQLGALTGNHLPLVNVLQQKRAKDEFQNVRDLVRWEVEDWKTIVTGKRGTQGTRFPPEVPGADDAEKATNYASILTRMMRDAFPTAAVAHAVSQDDIPGKVDLTTFFTKNVDFDLGRTHIETYFAEKPELVLAGVSDRAALKQQLQSFQRVHRLTPEYAQMRDLLGKNLHSAQAISRIGEAAFVTRFGPAWGANQAKLVFANAAQTATTALMVLAEHSPAFKGPGIAVLGGATEPPVAGMLNLENLFGSLDLCDCEHCRTVLSPAAYLVDILAYLKDRQIAGMSAKDILFQRRPDLGQIELTCENTNTLLPYVDLVDELLEDCVSPPSVPVARQTTGTVAALKANPQYLNLAAYDKLQAEVYPWSMPFHLASAEVHAYLDHLGVPRYELMRTFQKPGTTPNPTDAAIAADELGLTTFETQIITGAPLTPARQPWEFWGYPAATPGTWLADAGLRTVRVFLDKSGLSYAELVELLKAKFINPQPGDPKLGIVILSVDPLDPGTCDTTKLRITHTPNNLSLAEFQRFLDRTHRFVRLRSRLGWTARELDKAISALQGAIVDVNQRLTEAFLMRVSHIQRLRGDLHLSVEQILALWATIDSDGDAPAYQTLFQNPAVLNPVDENFQLNGAELKIVTSAPADALISKHTAPILAALGLSAADLAALTTTEVTDDLLNLANLSTLYRVSLLAKGLKLSIPDTLTLKALTGVDPFDAAHTGNTLRFVEMAAKVRTGGFSLAELDYLLRDNSSPFSAIPPTEARIAAVLDEIRSGLQKIADDTVLVPDPTGDLTRKNLSLLKWAPAIIEQVIATLNDTALHETLLASLPGNAEAPLASLPGNAEASLPNLSSGIVFPAPLLGKISYDNTEHKLFFNGVMTEADRNSLLALSTDPDYLTAVQFLFQIVFPATLLGKISYDIIEHKLLFNGVMTEADRNSLLGLSTDPDYQTAVQYLFQIVFPSTLLGKISYDTTTHILRFRGVMTEADSNSLLGLSDDPDYQTAVQILFDAPRNFGTSQMRAFEMPMFSATLASVPSGMVFPDEFKGRLFHDGPAGELHFNGFMTPGEKSALLSLPTPPNHVYTIAIGKLFNAGAAFAPTPDNRFLTTSEALAFFDTPVPVVERFQVVLEKLLSHLRDKSQKSLVKQQLGDALKLTLNLIDPLLTQWVNSSAQPVVLPAVKSLSDFLLPAFAQSHFQVNLTATAFPDQFQTFTRLHKVALVLSKFRVTVPELTWLFDYGPGLGWLDLNSVPATATSPSPETLFGGWGRLVDLFQLRDQLPLGASVLSDIFSAAREVTPNEVALVDGLSVGANWNHDDLQFLDGSDGFNSPFPAAYQDEVSLIRLRACFALMKKLGASAEQCFAWAKADLLSDDAASAKQTARAKYDDAQWLAIARPLRDVVREQQRASLVAWLVTHPDPAKSQTWRDANGLFGYFLIDVEMSPCQLTSRIKQAISSVQLFVQRCLMNIEPAVTANVQVDMHWREWKWMKNYRVWEANRKIFLYPENWIEPDLRDGKSPFFKDLESDLLQNEVTLETSEAALLTYVEKLDGVARLDVVGMYDQQEQDSAGNKAVDLLHVFGRTRNSPHLYHYRQRIDSADWTPWEKVELDIEGDHLIPVVWNRRLCVFWPIFTEKSRKDTSPGAGPDDQIKYWEIQIAWSEFKNKKWTAKRISKAIVETTHASIGSTFQPKEFFAFKGLFTEGDLAIRIYVPWGPRPYAEFSFAGCNSEPAVVLRGELIHVAPLVVPLESVSVNMNFVEDWANPGADGNVQAVLERKLNLVEGHFPLDLAPGSAGTFENSRQNILTLNKTPGIFNLLTAHQDRQFTAQRPFFFQDDRRAFFVSPETEQRPHIWSQPRQVRFESVAPIPAYYQQPVAVRSPVIAPVPGDLAVAEPTQEVEPVAVTTGQLTQVEVLPRYRLRKKYRFQTFYHPYVCPLLRELNRNGIDGLLQRPAQITPEQFLVPPQAFHFNITYQPEPVVAQPYPVEDVDFSSSGAYSSYNWELFFHVPLLIADRLSQNQRFEESQRWFHYVFDPTDTSGYPAPQKFWRTRRFFETSTAQYRNEQIQQMLQRLASGTADQQVDDQIKQWRKHPFNPHLIARMRTTAYQKSVVMKYLDNLIAWGDNLFRRDTIESLNEATQLYILAADILGRRPESIKPRFTPPAHTFNTLEPLLDHFSNALVQVENVVAVVPNTGTGSVVVAAPPPLSLPSTLYFCVPKNEKLLGYWDTVADRLFKIRHCMNIEGVVRQLPLFEPPIDPALLVRAAAAGLDISSALNDINAALPHYRFNVMAQKAGEVCAELKGLGGALLAALEKRDAEAVSLLRSAQELKVLDAVRQVRQRQVDEAAASLDAARKSRDVVVIRHEYYANIEYLNKEEKAHLTLSETGLAIQTTLATGTLVGKLLALIPNSKIGAPTSIGLTFGGHNLSQAAQAFSSYLGTTATLLYTKAGLSATIGGHKRRSDDWKFQERMASKELEQFDKQILAAEIRLAIAELELRNHDLQVENAREMDAFLHDKFTNRELYDWMVSQISGIYFQSYQLTYDLAKRAERAYRFELGLADSNFIQFGYWDSLRKGLLAGERLSHDLKRMEAAYLDLNRREYELTKQISLLLIDPVALLRLKETGECFVDLPEALFDLDFPGHYLRRIKSMSLTIPCVTGPYTGVHATLTQVQNSVRRTTTGTPYDRTGDNDPRFTDSLGAIQSIATSTGQNDSGLFELNFRDERYLPFEGAGAISQWRIELPQTSNRFDFKTIADVVLHLKYTARDGGETLRTAAQHALVSASGDLVRLFSMRHEFPTEWQRFLNPPETQPDQSVTLSLTPDRFPFQLPGKMIEINKVELFLQVSKPKDYTTPLKLSFGPTAQVQEFTLEVDQVLDGLPHGTKMFNASLNMNSWTLSAKIADIPESLRLPVIAHAHLNPEAIEDLWILCHYMLISE